MVGYRQTNQKTDTGKTLTRWPVFVDHFSGMGTKAHDLFVLPLCRAHHDELHADTVAFEEKHGSQLELLFRFLDRSLAIGVLA